MPADAAMGCALQTVLPAGTLFVTTELSLRVLRPARPGARVVVRGTVIEARRTLGLTQVRLTDETGNLVAHGSSLLLVQPLRPAPATTGAQPPAPQSEGPDPWQDSPPATTLEQEVWDGMSGLQVLSAQLAGELALPPIHYLTGLELRSLQTMLPAGTALAPIDLKVNYLRPLAADGRQAVASGRVVHSGRRVAVASAEVLDGDRKPVAVATGSAIFLPGRAASLVGGDPSVV